MRYIVSNVPVPVTCRGRRTARGWGWGRPEEVVPGTRPEDQYPGTCFGQGVEILMVLLVLDVAIGWMSLWGKGFFNQPRVFAGHGFSRYPYGVILPDSLVCAPYFSA